MRAEIEAIPDGVYSFEDAIEDDGITDRDYPIKLLLTIDGDEVIADFTGSAPQAAGPVNAIFAVTASAVYNAFLHLTDPTIPRNEGCYRPFTIIAPPGTIVNCAFPAPVAGGNTETSPRITDMIFGALQHAIPDVVAASCGGTSSPFLFGGTDPRTGEPYAHFHFEGVGWGGRKGLDGNNMVVTINGNCRNTPVEVFETRYPAFRIESYRLVADSGGPGEFRGGLGGERVFTVTVPEVTVSALLNRMKTEPWGVLGGGEGAVGGLWVRRAGDARVAHVRRGVRDDVAVEVLRRDAARRATRCDPDAGRRRLRRPAAARPRARAPRRRRGIRQRRGGARGLRARGGAGRWASGSRNEISYLKANRAACALCGHPIARRYWGAGRRCRAHVLLAGARAAVPRLLAPPLRTEGGLD